MSYRRIIKGYLRQCWYLHVFNATASIFYIMAVAAFWFDFKNPENLGMFVALQVFNGNLFLGFSLGFHLRSVTEGTLACMVPNFREKHLLASLFIALPFILLPPLMLAMVGLHDEYVAQVLAFPMIMTLWCAYRFGFALTVVPILGCVFANMTLKQELPTLTGMLDVPTVVGINLVTLAGVWLFVRVLSRKREGETAMAITSETLAQMPGGWRWGQITPLARTLLQPTFDRIRLTPPKHLRDLAVRLEVGLSSPAFRAGTIPFIFVLINLLVIAMHTPMGVVAELQEADKMDVYVHIAYLTCGISGGLDILQNRSRLILSWLHTPTNRLGWVRAVYLAYARMLLRLFLLTNVGLLILHLFLPLFNLQSLVTAPLFGLTFLSLFFTSAAALITRENSGPGVVAMLLLMVVYTGFMVFYAVLTKDDQPLAPVLLLVLAAALLNFLMIRIGMRRMQHMNLDFTKA